MEGRILHRADSDGEPIHKETPPVLQPVRVIERGSGETLACGTGACASAVAAIYHGLTERNVTVHLPGGDLSIQWKDNTSPVLMTGPATEVFRGEVKIER